MKTSTTPLKCVCCRKCAGMTGLKKSSGIHAGQCWNFKCECHQPTTEPKCECENPTIRGNDYNNCVECGLPIQPTAEPKHPDSCTASVKEPSYMHSEECPLRRSTTKPKPYKSWEELWLENVPTPSPVVKWEWKKRFKRELSDIAPPTGYKNVAKYCISFITTLLHSEREKERERIVKMIEWMKYNQTNNSESQPKTFRETEVRIAVLSSLRDKLSTK